MLRIWTGLLFRLLGRYSLRHLCVGLGTMLADGLVCGIYRSRTTTRSRRTVSDSDNYDSLRSLEYHEKRIGIAIRRMFNVLMHFYRLPQGLAEARPRALRPGTTSKTPLKSIAERYYGRPTFEEKFLNRIWWTNVRPFSPVVSTADVRTVSPRPLPSLPVPSTSCVPLCAALLSSTTAVFVLAVVSPWLS